MACAADTARWGIHLLVERMVRRDPAAHAVRDSTTGRQISYAQLWDASGAMASELRRRGVGAGTVVAVALGRGIELVTALLGIARVGASYLPLDSHGPVRRWTEIATIAAATQVVVADPGADAPDGPAVLAMVSLPSAGQYDDSPVESDRPLCVYFTSGTTGRPKGVVVPHRAVHRLVSGADYCPVEPGHRVAAAANPAFDATTFEIWSTLTAGATIVVLPDVADVGLDSWLDLVRAEQVTTMFLTTSLFHMVAHERPDALRSLSTLLVGGEQMEPALARRLLAAGPPARLVNVYGPTETTTFATYYDCTAESLAGVGRVPVGQPIQATVIEVVDGSLRPVPDGREGELVIGGPGVALGYLGQPELTAQRFVAIPPGGLFYRTGDVARRLPSGAVEVLGRRDRQIKMRGFRIEPDEIEQALLATGLLDVAIVEKVGDGLAAFLAGFVLPRAGAPPSAGDLPHALETALTRVLPAYLIPTRWCVLESLPLGPTGKIDRAQLLRSLASASRAAPGGQTLDDRSAGDASAADRIAGIWYEVLGVEALDRAIDFVGAGGNSILAIQASSRIREFLSLPCEPMDVLLAANVADLADRLHAAAGWHVQEDG